MNNIYEKHKNEMSQCKLCRCRLKAMLGSMQLSVMIFFYY